MVRLCKIFGTLIAASGLVLAIYFASLIARDETYARAALAASRNPGNILYEAELKQAQALRAFQTIFGSLGGLLALNGLTLILVGVAAGRQPEHR